MAVDVADPKLLGKRLEERYAAQVDLCIDHHGSNTLYAAQTLLDASAGAACEVIYEVLRALEVEMDAQIADCIYTGLSTDTGCFRYSNATARTHRIAADMIDCGAGYQPDIVRRYQKCIQLMKKVPDIESLAKYNSLNYEVLKGDKNGISSIRYSS